MARIAKVFDPIFLDHMTPAGHPERSERLLAIIHGLEKAALLEKLGDIPIRKASIEEIALVHAKEYIQQVAKSAQRQGEYFDSDTYASQKSYDVACFAAGALLNAVEQVHVGHYDAAFAVLRPPGHHAEVDHAMGFCFFNNVAIAAEYLIRHLGYQKVAIVDFDVHHGNGTQHAFYGRDDVLFISTHRYPFYPGTGAASETGVGAGQGYTLNIPMSAGDGDIEYEAVFEEKVIPALYLYKPDFLLVSAGFDAHERDPLGGMRLTSAAYGWMAQRLKKAAQELCHAKVVFTLEGGYDLQALSESVVQVFEAFM